jgi:hypothetical protein
MWENLLWELFVWGIDWKAYTVPFEMQTIMKFVFCLNVWMPLILWSTALSGYSCYVVSFALHNPGGWTRRWGILLQRTKNTTVVAGLAPLMVFKELYFFCPTWVTLCFLQPGSTACLPRTHSSQATFTAREAKWMWGKETPKRDQNLFSFYY